MTVGRFGVEVRRWMLSISEVHSYFDVTEARNLRHASGGILTGIHFAAPLQQIQPRNFTLH
jgi:hypothetical protein